LESAFLPRARGGRAAANLGRRASCWTLGQSDLESCATATAVAIPALVRLGEADQERPAPLVRPGKRRAAFSRALPTLLRQLQNPESDAQASIAAEK